MLAMGYLPGPKGSIYQKKGEHRPLNEGIDKGNRRKREIHISNDQDTWLSRHLFIRNLLTYPIHKRKTQNLQADVLNVRSWRLDIR